MPSWRKRLDVNFLRGGWYQPLSVKSRRSIAPGRLPLRIIDSLGRAGRGILLGVLNQIWSRTLRSKSKWDGRRVYFLPYR
jgi:hypothetical protein